MTVSSALFLFHTILKLFLFLILLGVCDQNHVNDFTLHDGSVTSDSSTFIQDWTVEKPGKTCEMWREDKCSEHALSLCQLLLSHKFAECHMVIPPNLFYEACEESSCYEDEACEMITSYAHICRENGVCIDWRTPEICRKDLTLLKVRQKLPEQCREVGWQLLDVVHCSHTRGSSEKQLQAINE